MFGWPQCQSPLLPLLASEAVMTVMMITGHDGRESLDAAMEGVL